MAKVGFPLGLGLLFLFCNGFFPFVKKRRKTKRLKCIGRLGGVICFMGEISEPGTKRRPLRQIQRLLLEKNGLCILILPYLN